MYSRNCFIMLAHLVAPFLSNITMFRRLSSINFFRMHFYYFQLLGMCPIILSHSTKLNLTRDFTILKLISIIHITILTSSIVIVYTYSRKIFFDDDMFGKFNDTIKYIGVVIAYYAILLESFLKRGHQSNIWKLLARCHSTVELDVIDQCKLWNSKQFNSCFFGSYCIWEIHL